MSRLIFFPFPALASRVVAAEMHQIFDTYISEKGIKSKYY
jgi:hypothetical protein